MATRVRSHCKINLGLAVGPPRPDGFHGLTTVYQTLALYDVVTVSARLLPPGAAQPPVVLAANHPGVPCTASGDAERNTACRMVAGALARMGVAAEVAIELDKRLPVQGGLGAGSANAVAALLGLERELAAAGVPPLSGAERLQLAAEVGSDVPLFLLGGTVLGLGRGEQVYPLPESPALPCVVAVPAAGVSTAAAFAQIDAALTFAQEADRLRELSFALAAVWTPTGSAAGPSGITRADLGSRPEKGASEVQAQRGDLAETPELPSNSWNGLVHPLLALVRTGIENDFEGVVFSQHPSLRSTKRDLVGAPGDGAVYAALSGSGSALFGLYETAAAAGAAQQRVQANGTRAIVTKTLPRREYWHTIFAE